MSLNRVFLRTNQKNGVRLALMYLPKQYESDKTKQDENATREMTKDQRMTLVERAGAA